MSVSIKRKLAKKINKISGGFSRNEEKRDITFYRFCEVNNKLS